MVGKPNPEAKTPRLVLEARNDAEIILIRRFKEVVAEKGEYPLEILKPTLAAYVGEHWPPNPQLQIPQFTGDLPFSRETQLKFQLDEAKGKRRECDCGGRENCSVCGGKGFYYEQ
jgi:hypothetical protein